MYQEDPAVANLVKRGIAMARNLARRCCGQGVDQDDLESEAMLALVRAAQAYQPSEYGSRTFRPWASLWICRALRKVVRDAPMAHIAGIPARLKGDAARCRIAVLHLEARGIRRPSDHQIAGEANLPIETVELVAMIPNVLVRQALVEWCEEPSGTRNGEPPLVPMFGSQPGWSPDHACRDVHAAAIPKGSNLCCMVCHESGQDHLKVMRRNPKTDPKPEPKAPEEAFDPMPALRRHTELRRDKRQRIFGPTMVANVPASTAQDRSID